MKEHDLGGGMTKQWLACFEELRLKVDFRTPVTQRETFWRAFAFWTVFSISGRP